MTGLPRASKARGHNASGFDTGGFAQRFRRDQAHQLAKLVLTGSLGVGWGLAYAGPPFQTDDPEPVDLHHIEVNVASQQTLTVAGRSGTRPLVEMNYGALPDVQLHVAAPLAFNNPTQGIRQSGLGDAEVGVKYRMVQESEATPMVAIYPTYLFPTGDAQRGLGNGRYQTYLPVWLQKSWGTWTCIAGAGYWINHGPMARNNWFAGWLVQRRVGQQLTVGAELFHRSEQTVGQGESSGFNVGGIFDLSEHHHLLLSIGRGLQNREATNRVSSYLAYQFTN